MRKGILRAHTQVCRGLEKSRAQILQTSPSTAESVRFSAPSRWPRSCSLSGTVTSGRAAAADSEGRRYTDGREDRQGEGPGKESGRRSHGQQEARTRGQAG